MTTLLLERPPKKRTKLTVEQFQAQLYISVFDTTHEITVRQPIVWGQDRVILGVVTEGIIDHCRILDLPSGPCEALLVGAINNGRGLIVRVTDIIILSNITWPSKGM